MAGKILAATDGSPAGQRAVSYAAELAKKIGAGLIALRVIHEEKFASLEGYAPWESVRQDLLSEIEKEALKILEEAREIGQRAGVEVDGVVRRGSPDEQIINFARENRDIIMVVMGSHGKGPLERLTVGSKTVQVAQEVGRRLPVPLLVVPSSLHCPECRLEI